MTCSGNPGSGVVDKGYGPLQRTYTVPATVPIAFPAGSTGLPSCYMSATTQVPVHTHGFVHVAIVTH